MRIQHHPDDASAVLSSNDISAIAGLSLRQVQWHSETKILRPRIHGHFREFAFKDALLACFVADLRDKGLSLARLRRLLPRLRLFAENAAPDRIITTNGTKAEMQPPEEAVKAIVNAKEGIYLICVNDQIEKISRHLYAKRNPKVQRAASTDPERDRFIDSLVAGLRAAL
jgi:DNA-binding transcriptional MerR regulator